MKNFKKVSIFILILFAIGAGYVFLTNKTSAPVPVSKEAVQEAKTDLSINSGSQVQSFDISQFIGKTALEATSSVTKIQTSGNGENAFVTSINGKVADSKNHEFWELVINGQPAQVGAGSYIIQKGDSILWKLSTY